MPDLPAAFLESHEKRLTRRQALRYVALGLSLTFAGACTPRSRSVATPIPASAALQPTRSAPRHGGTFRLGIAGDLARLDGHLVQGELQNTFWHIFDRLTAYDDKLQPQPMLAESWDVSADSKRLKLSLRQGVQFHNGRELTSEDVRWNFERIKDPKVGTLAARAQVISGYELPDRHTLIVSTDRPWTEAFDLLEYTSILDPLSMQPDGGPSRVGTGPFRLGDYSQGDHLRLIRNTNYWRSGQPYADEFLVSIGSDAQTLIAQLEGGALDAVSGPSFVDAVRLRKNPSYQVVVNARSGAFYCILPNATRPPTDNKVVRQALNYAVDRKRIVDTVLQGLGEPRVLPWAPSSPAYDATKNGAYVFDPDRARSLLNQAGVSSATFDVSSQVAPPYVSTAQIYLGDLSGIGITGTVKPSEPAAYLAQVQNVSYNGVMVTGGLNGHMKPMTMILGPYYGPQFNYSGFTDEAYTQLTRAVSSESDPAKQQALYAQLNEYYLDQAWVIPVAQNPNRVAARENVRGLHYDMHEALVISDVWLAS